jgi:hypothetical protein
MKLHTLNFQPRSRPNLGTQKAFVLVCRVSYLTDVGNSKLLDLNAPQFGQIFTSTKDPHAEHATLSRLERSPGLCIRCLLRHPINHVDLTLQYRTPCIWPPEAGMPFIFKAIYSAADMTQVIFVLLQNALSATGARSVWTRAHLAMAMIRDMGWLNKSP